MLNVTSIWGIPAGEGGIPASWNSPSSSFFSAISRSPWNTRTCTEVWLSAAVVKIFDSSVGIVVFLSISRSNRPPFTSMPRLSGVTSNNTMSSTSPPRTPPWIAAPSATASSGLTFFFGSVPRISSTFACTCGIRVDPPTRITSSISSAA
jgi:hypothetical protein